MSEQQSVVTPPQPSSISSDGTAEDPEPDHPEHQIAAAIDRCIHRARDHKLVARTTMPTAVKGLRTSFETIGKELVEGRALLESGDPAKVVIGVREVQGTIVRFERLKNSEIPRVLETGLFLGLFSAFDAFTGDLLTALFTRKPDLFASINRTLTFAEVLEAANLDEVKIAVLQDEIEQFRRKSYVEQFEYPSIRFDIKLTGFDRWPQFVERAQRRNLFAHCNGVVSEQYCKVCKQAGVPSADLPALGHRLSLGARYFYESCELLIEVALKLGQTLWRKVLPQELSEADRHLKAVLYDTLLNRQWKRAQMIGEFAISQRNISTDVDRKILLVNYAQSLKFDGQKERARSILNRVDWSASANDFKLAEAVLLEHYEDAAAIMKRIGEKGEFISETGYHTWPLFNEFRETSQFRLAYEAIYGRPYLAKLQAAASAAEAGAAMEVQRETQIAEGMEQESDRAVDERLDQGQQLSGDSDTD